MIDHDRLGAIIGEAADMAYRLWPGAGNRVRTWEKAPGDPVCEADLAVDRFLRRELRTLLPAAGWLSEETVDDPARLAGDLVWIVDPIDGTRDYIRGRDGWAVSVCLVGAGRPLIAILAAPARGERWQGVAGMGSLRNGKRLRVSGHARLDGARTPSDGLPKADRMLVPVTKPNSIALRIAMVAGAAADLVATARRGGEWDIAAAVLIAREAGAETTDARGNQLTFNKRSPHGFGVLVAPPALHAEALEHFTARREAATR
jgi:myo-inositol-1(or 4)-monophosphatase